MRPAIGIRESRKPGMVPGPSRADVLEDADAIMEYFMFRTPQGRRFIDKMVKAEEERTWRVQTWLSSVPSA